MRLQPKGKPVEDVEEGAAQELDSVGTVHRCPATSLGPTSGARDSLTTNLAWARPCMVRAHLEEN